VDFTWKFAQGKINFSLPDDKVKAILKRKGFSSGDSLNATVEEALANPIGTPPLREMITRKKARSVLIVVNDVTRPTPYREMLPPLMKEIEAAGIADDRVTILIANGIHREQTLAESRTMYGDEICARYRVVNHSPDHNLADLGTISAGFDLQVNRLVVESDFVITTGLIGLHYIAGFSGGRKSIIPGVAGRSTITATHALMADPRACLGNIRDNPVHQMLTEGALRAGVDFILNVVTDDEKKIVAAVAGDLEEAWQEGVRVCREASVCCLEKSADIVIAGCGGYPKDINLYQAQKALESSVQAVREGGGIILVAGCQEGLGEETFARWVEEADTPEDIKERFINRFELGGHKAYAICRTLEKCQVILVSNMEPNLVRKTFMTPCASVEEALRMAYQLVGKNPEIAVLPEAPAIAVQIMGQE